MRKVKNTSKRHRFSSAIVIVCLVVSFIITAAVLYEYHRLAVLIPANVLTVLFSLWGGELLLLCVRTTLSDAIAKPKEAKPEEAKPEEKPKEDDDLPI